MSQQVLKEIIEKCLEIDKIALNIYQTFYYNAHSDSFRAFWGKMIHDEKLHVAYWEDLSKTCDQNLVPQVFEKPFEILDDLKDTLKHVIDIRDESAKFSDSVETLNYTLQLEFYLLNPAFEMLFQYGNLSYTNETPASSYNDHLDIVVEFAQQDEFKSYSLLFYSKLIKKLWKSTREYILRSKTDSLTSLYNRQGLFESITALGHFAKRNKLPVACIMIDIDDFKAINDNFGHHAGDSVIKDVAKTLKNTARRSDIIGRFGGEEFLLFMVDAESKSLDNIGEDLRLKVNEKCSSVKPITISIGISSGYIASEVNDRIAELVKIADDNLYKAKASGKNCVVSSTD